MDEKIKSLIQNHIDNNEVCLFMKGTPDAPQCGFSMAVSNILKHLNVKFKKFYQVHPSFLLRFYSSDRTFDQE